MLGSLLRVERWLVGEDLTQKCAYNGTSECGEAAAFGSRSCKRICIEGGTRSNIQGREISGCISGAV